MKISLNNLRGFLLSILTIAVFFGMDVPLKAQSPLKFTIETFDTLAVGSLPMTWRNRDGDKTMYDEKPEHLAEYYYTVHKEGNNHFLRFDGIKGKHLSYPLADKDIKLSDLPYLNWKWRAIQLPEGANEDNEKTNDAVLSVYVVFKILRFSRLPKVIRYSWSSTLDKGTVLSKNFAKQKIIILESGTEKVGEWIDVKRNLIEDYRMVFGDDPPNEPIAVLILSDGNNVEKRAIGDYDDLFLSAN